MDELIRKQDAIDLIMGQPPEPHYPSWYTEQIKVLPPVQPKRKGYKIDQHRYPAKWVCSECGAKHFDFSDNFCSQCGVDVRGIENGTD